MFFILLLYAAKFLCRVQYKDYISVASHIRQLTEDDSTSANVLIAEGEDKLAMQVLKELSIDRETSFVIGELHNAIGKKD